MVALQTSQVGRVAMALSAVPELHSIQFKQVEGQGVTSYPFLFTFLKLAQKPVTEGQERPRGWSGSPRAPSCGEPTGLPRLRKTLSSLAHTHRSHSLSSSPSYNLPFHCSRSSIRPTQVFAYSKALRNSSQIQISSRM